MDDGKRISPVVEELLRYARAGHSEKVDLMIRADASLLNSVEAGGFAALHFAAAHGHKDLLRCLVGHKASIDIMNFDRHTPLMLAARCNQKEMAEMLLDAGADVNAANSSGVTAAHHAAKFGNLAIMKMLISRGAKVQVPVGVATTARHGSALHWAADGGNLEMIGYLLYNQGISVNVQDEHGGTPLFSALVSKQSDAAQFLLENGADFSIPAVGGTTPLHIAVGHCPLDIVKLLVDFGADPSAKDQDGETPLDVAAAADKKNFIAALSRPQFPSDPAKRAEEANRFKEHGNKVFAEGENNKAFKFYSRAIALTPTNHVLFSNRSACNFNTLQFLAGLHDAQRCVALKPDWPKGYLRLGANLKALRRLDEAMVAAEQGLKMDPVNTDLKTLRADLVKLIGDTKAMD